MILILVLIPSFFWDNHHEQWFNDSTPTIGFNHHDIGLQPIIHVTLQPRNGDGIKSKSMTYGLMNFTVPCILRFIHRATKIWYILNDSDEPIAICRAKQKPNETFKTSLARMLSARWHGQIVSSLAILIIMAEMNIPQNPPWSQYAAPICRTKPSRKLALTIWILGRKREYVFTTTKTRFPNHDKTRLRTTTRTKDFKHDWQTHHRLSA